MVVRGRVAAFLICMLTLSVVGPCAGASAKHPRGSSKLVRLVKAIEPDGDLVHADFAAIALDAMIDAYERELEAVASPQPSLSERERSKQWRWAAAARSFLDTIYRARELLYAGEPVELVTGSPVEVQILVGEVLVPVSSPRIDRPGALEDDVVANFCYVHECNAELLKAIDAAGEDRRGGWSMRQGMGSTYITEDGLAFMFQSVRDRAFKEKLCQRTAAELRAVVDALKHAEALGMPIDWEALRVIRSPASGAERLVLNDRQRLSHVPAPILLSSPGILKVARPWLRARMHGHSAEQLFPRADLLFSNLPAAR